MNYQLVFDAYDGNGKIQQYSFNMILSASGEIALPRKGEKIVIHPKGNVAARSKDFAGLKNSDTSLELRVVDIERSTRLDDSLLFNYDFGPERVIAEVERSNPPSDLYPIKKKRSNPFKAIYRFLTR